MVCGITQPLTDLSWLKTLKEEYASGEMAEYNYIGQASYEGDCILFGVLLSKL